MSTLREFTTVQCGFEDVPARLYAHFDGAAGTMPLRVRIGDLRLERDVAIHLKPKPSYPGYRLLDISWEPNDGGPYPVFWGTLSVADEGAGWSRVELDGTYNPPFGVVGAVFDASVGHRIAQATASEFLAEFKRILTAVPR